MIGDYGITTIRGKNYTENLQHTINQELAPFEHVAYM